MVEMSTNIELPQLPSYLWTPLGLVEVLTSNLDDAAALWNPFLRQITINPNGSAVTQWQSIGHELMHAIIDDSGVSETFTKKQEEAICRAFGSFLANWVISGGDVPFAEFDNDEYTPEIGE